MYILFPKYTRYNIWFLLPKHLTYANYSLFEVRSFVLLQATFNFSKRPKDPTFTKPKKFCVSGQMEYWEYMENFLSHFLEEEMDEVKSTISR